MNPASSTPGPNPEASSGSNPAHPAWLKDWQNWAETALQAQRKTVEFGPEGLAEALDYPVQAGGKRLRPCLVRMICEACGGTASEAEPAAVAIEWLHTYSLVHDDLPCMDDDDLRRGLPTTHKRFGESTAVLVGDGLLTLGFELLAQSHAPQRATMMGVLARAAGPAGMVGGQFLDLEAEGQAKDAEAIRRIHRLKTAALIAAACQLGALSANASEAVVEHARRYGVALGLCFQAVDDCLDVTGSAQELGKTPGKDAASEKATLVGVLGLEGAQKEADQLAQQAIEAAREAGFAEPGPVFEIVRWLLSRRN